jgi:putative transposase
MTSDAMSPRRSENGLERHLSPVQAAAAAMVAVARARGLALAGPNGGVEAVHQERSGDGAE